MISTVYISPILTSRPSCSFPDFSHSHALRSSQSDSFNDPVFLTVFGTVSEYRERCLWIFLGSYFVDLIRACKDKLLEARHANGYILVTMSFCRSFCRSAQNPDVGFSSLVTASQVAPKEYYLLYPRSTLLSSDPINLWP
jgi:competence transcription factor ComK